MTARREQLGGAVWLLGRGEKPWDQRRQAGSRRLLMGRDKPLRASRNWNLGAAMLVTAAASSILVPVEAPVSDPAKPTARGSWPARNA